MAKGGFVDIATREAAATATRRAKKAAKAAGAGKNKQQEERRFSLAREDRYVRSEASLATVNDMLPLVKGDGPRWSFYAAKPEQVSREKCCEFLDTAPLLCEENVDEKWVQRTWPSVLDTCKLMQVGDVQHWKREIQNPERIWKTTLYVKRVA